MTCIYLQSAGYVLKISGHSRLSLVSFGNVLDTNCKSTETESKIVLVKRYIITGVTSELAETRVVITRLQLNLLLWWELESEEYNLWSLRSGKYVDGWTVSLRIKVVRVFRQTVPNFKRAAIWFAITTIINKADNHTMTRILTGEGMGSKSHFRAIILHKCHFHSHS